MSTLEALTDQLHATSLPTGWRWSSLSDLLVGMESGSRPKGGAVGINGGVPSISAEHMTPHGTFDFSVLRYVPRDYYDNMPRGHIRRGDILIVKDGATTGKTCFVDDTFPFDEAVVNEHVFICRADAQQMLPELLFLWLWGPQGQYEIRSCFQGAAIGGINQSFTNSVNIPVPAVVQQPQILAQLTLGFRAIEAARSAVQTRLEAARLLTSATLRSVFAPLRGYRHRPLGDIASRGITYGIVQSGDHVAGGVPTVRGGDVRDFRIDRNQLKQVDPIISQQYSRTVLQGDEILLVIRGFPGNVAQVTPSLIGCNVAREIAVIPVPESYCRTYLQYAIASPDVQQRIADKTQGAAQQGINLSDVAELEVPDIGRDAQAVVASRLEAALSQAERALLAIVEEANTINAMPGALVRRAFCGGA